MDLSGPRPGRRYGYFIVQESVLWHRYEALDLIVRGFRARHRYEALGLSVSKEAGPGTGMRF